MDGASVALGAELLEFQAVLQDFLVLCGAVIERLTDGTFHFNEGILGHREAKSVELIDEMIREFRFCVNLSGIFGGLGPV